jgi:hypothetical protein
MIAAAIGPGTATSTTREHNFSAIPGWSGGFAREHESCTRRLEQGIMDFVDGIAHQRLSHSAVEPL